MKFLLKCKEYILACIFFLSNVTATGSLFVFVVVVVVVVFYIYTYIRMVDGRKQVTT